jgi:hypothetical protein
VREDERKKCEGGMKLSKDDRKLWMGSATHKASFIVRYYPSPLSSASFALGIHI